MVTRRKYRTRADQTPADVTNVAVVPAQGLPAAPTAASDGNGTSPLQRALEAQQHAEQLQTQHQHRQRIGLPEPALDPHQRQLVDQHIDGLAVTPHWKRFLKSHPSLLVPPYHASMMHQYDIALRAGVPDNSVHMDHAILLGVGRDLEHHHNLSQLAAPARSTPSPAQMHDDGVDQHVADLNAEAAQHMAAEHRPAPVALSPSPKKRSMPMSAPVSRAAPDVSGRPAVNNHLTADEVRIAHNSFSDPSMSNRDKELLYLQNKRKLHRMREDGSYSEQRG